MRNKDVEYLALHHPEYLSLVERNYWVNFALLTLDNAFYNFSFTMFSQDTILPFFVSSLTKSALLIALVPTLFFLGGFFPQLLGAFLANRWSARKWQIFSIAVTQRLGLFLIALVAQSLGILPPNLILIFFFLARLRGAASSQQFEARILGPSPAPITNLRGKFRFHILLIGRQGDQLRAIVRTATDGLKPPNEVIWIADVDPLDML